MERELRRRIYDPGSAQLVAGVANGFSKTDPRYLSETLYRKANGQFFLIVCKGVQTIAPNDNAFYDYDIVPMNWHQARKWSCENMDVDDFNSTF